MPNHAEQLAQELNLSLKNVQGAIDLIDAGNTIPFIARYRKEATGSMDDQVLRNLGDRLEYLRGLDKRKEEVTGSIEAQNAMTPELQAALAGAKTLAEVEDIYRPYKPKRKTRASIARARGLQPLADATLKQDANFDPQTAANDYLNEEVPDAAAALAGAQDIIAETISDDAHCRAELRRYYHAFGMVKSVKARTKTAYTPSIMIIPSLSQNPWPPYSGPGPRRAGRLFEGEHCRGSRARRGALWPGCSPAKRPAAPALPLWKPRH